MAVDLSNLQFNNPLSSLQSPITSGDSSQQPGPFQPAAQSQPASFATPSQTSTQSSTPLNNMLQHGQDLQNRIAQSSTAVKSPTTTPPIDFSSALKPASGISFNNPLSALQSPVSSDNSQVKAPTGGGMMPPTPTTQPLSNTPTGGGTMAPTVGAPSTLDNTPTTPTPTQGTTGGIIPTASAGEPDPKFTDFVTKAYQAGLNDTEVKQAVDMAIKNGTLTDPNASNNQSSQDALSKLSPLQRSYVGPISTLGNELVAKPIDSLIDWAQGRQQDPDNTYSSADLAKTGNALMGATFNAIAPVFSAAMNIAAQTPGIHGLPDALGTVVNTAGSILTKIPGLSDFKNTLTTDEDKKAFDAFIGSLGLLGGADATGRLTNGLTAPDIIKGFENATENIIPKAVEKTASTAEGIGNKIAEVVAPNLNKIDKTSRGDIMQASGMTPTKFALQNGLFKGASDLDGVADNASQLKTQAMQDKIDATKSFGTTNNTPLYTRMAMAIKDNIQGSLDQFTKGLSDSDKQTIINQAHGEQQGVINALDKFTKTPTVSYTQLEALKSLYDYYNPDNIKWDTQKSLSEGSAAQRGVLQSDIENAGTKNGVDIAQMNKNIQAAHALETGVDKLNQRQMGNSLINLNDTQLATMASVLDGGAGAVGSLLAKKGLIENTGLRSWLADKLYTPNENANVNSESNPTPVSRVGKLVDTMNNNNPIPLTTYSNTRPLKLGNK